MKFNAIRMLGACGITASFLTMVGGWTGNTVTIGVGGAVMTFANVYALWIGK